MRRAFGIVFQDPSLDNELTASENMELHGVLYGVPAGERRKRIEELLKFVELWDRRGDYVKTYSGGMRRRLEVARALLHKPKILFLDEPTLGLDPQTRNHIWSFIQKSERGRESHRFFHHALHGRGRSRRRTGRRDRSRKDRGAGNAGGIEGAARRPRPSRMHSSNLTGHTIRDEEASSTDRMRMMRRVWRGR